MQNLATISEDYQALKVELAKLLFEKSYKEGDFTLASGKKSSYYFDGRQTALNPKGSWLIGNLFNHLLKDIPVLHAVGGMTLGADPLVTATSLIGFEKGKDIAAFIVRKEAKGHGTGNYIEGLGNIPKGSKVAMLEDVVTTGGSLLKACDRVKEAGLEIVAVATILDREEGGKEAIESAGYSLLSLFTRQELVELAKK